MTVPARTAEWNCSRCGTTNRKLVAAGTTRTNDRCTHCRAKHVVEVDSRPVRWNARVEE
jgi:DNA-directed RNA polymerase subunit RPC12/RpoP